MTVNEAWQPSSDGRSIMITVTRDGQELSLEVVSRAMILLSERAGKAWGNAVADALMGKS